jgi:hypothetical protein
MSQLIIRLLETTIAFLTSTFPVENNPRPRATQGLVGGGRDDVAKGERRRDYPCGDKSSDVRHVRHQL